MRDLTTREVSEITGIRRATIIGWIEAGIIEPVGGGGKGRGNDYLFRPTQVVGSPMRPERSRSIQVRCTTS